MRYFFFDSQLTGLIQMNKILQYQSISHNRRSILVHPVELFSARWRSGDFQYKPWFIPLEAFVSKNHQTDKLKS